MVKAIVNEYTENTYIINEGKDAFIVDPGAHAESIFEEIANRELTVRGILLTHGHFDHMFTVNEVQEKFDCPIYIHELERDFLFDPNLNLSSTITRPIKVKNKKAVTTITEEDVLTLGETTITVLHIPGHTRGSVGYRYRRYLFSGDVLFKGTIGRTDLPTSSDVEIYASLKKLIRLCDDNTLVYPGHGHFTTILNEKRDNPFIKRM